MMQKEILRKIITNFIDIVRINVFLTTSSGRSIITPEPNHYGWELLANAAKIKANFKNSQDFLEYVDDFGLHHFTLKLKSPAQDLYLVIGPIILNKKLSREHYLAIASTLSSEPEKIIESLNEVRVISQNQLKSILDLFLDLTRLFNSFTLANDLMYRNETKINKVLGPVLDLALEISHAQSGSIMIFENKKGLAIQVAKGINAQYVYQEPRSLEDGIAGTALREGKTFILTNKSEDNRLGELLKRKEITQSIVMPFENSLKTIRGVLSLNRYESKKIPSERIANVVKILSQITSNSVNTV